MSHRNLINDLLAKRWNDTDSPTAGTAVSVTSQVNDVGIPTQQRHNLETLSFWIWNRTGAGGVAATVTVNVRHGTIAGTVMASYQQLVAASSVTNVSMTNLMLQGKRGKAIRVTMDTVVASLTQSVTAAGWYEDD